MNRRKFLRNTSIASGALGLAGYGFYSSIDAKISKDIDASTLSQITPSKANVWKNWSGHQRCNPSFFFEPKTESELIEQIKKTNTKIRVVGGGHSFSPVVPTNDVLASLRYLKGILSHDAETNVAKLWAGSPLYEITEDLYQAGYCFANQGDIDRQTVGGAVSTSTHGTGIDLTSFAGMVKGFRLVTASGEVLNCNQTQNPDLYYGGTVALGALGIVTQYDIELLPKYKLKERVYPAKLNDVLDNFDNLAKQNRNFELFPFFYSDNCLVKELNPTNEPETAVVAPFPSDDFLLALGITLSGESGQRVETVTGIIEDLLEETQRVGYAHRIYPSVRNVKFNEMEYELPAENGVACLREIIQTGKKQAMPIFFPLEMRTVKRDSFWLSPFYEQDTVSISMHHFAEYGFENYFRVFHQILKKYGGRPHWGKLQYYNQAEIKALYPKYNNFVKLKRELDPSGRFTNEYLTKLFG